MAREARFDFLDERPLFREDLTPAERKRSDLKRRETQKAAPAIAVGETKDAATLDALAVTKPHVESRRRVVNRLTQDLINPDASLQMPGESTIPGADWYPRVHGARLRGIANETGVEHETVATTSGVMSPQNPPEAERAAVRALADAHSKDATFEITPAVKEVTEASMGIDKKTGERKPTPVSDLGEGTARFSEMSPEQIRDLTSKTVRDSHVVASTMDLAGVARAGTNKVNGVRGIRGATVNELAPPNSAPKVATYTRHGYTFGVPHDEDAARGYGSGPAAPESEEPKFGGDQDPFIAEEIRFRATHAATQMRGQTTLDAWGLNDDSIEMTKGLHDYLSSKGAPVRARSIGQRVQVRDLHPAAVLALSHPDVSDHHPDGERLQKLAKLSSNLPTVIDSHANGTIHGYKGLVAKPTGSGAAGYWATKTLEDGTPIMDSRDARVTEPGLQHAEYDSLFRDTAKNVVKEMDMDMDYPSTAVQAGLWTKDRRLGQDDPAFNRHVREMDKTAAAIEKDNKRTSGRVSMPEVGRGADGSTQITGARSQQFKQPELDLGEWR